MVDAQEVDGAVGVGEAHAQVVAGDGVGPVRDAVGVDFAAEHADRGGVGVVGRGPDGAARTENWVDSGGAEEREENGAGAHRAEGME